jgi:hypothetical protein
MIHPDVKSLLDSLTNWPDMLVRNMQAGVVG